MRRKVTVEQVRQARDLIAQGLSKRRAAALAGLAFQTMQYHLETPAQRLARLDGRRRARKAMHLLGLPSTRPERGGAALIYEEAAAGFDRIDICRAFARGDFDRAELSRRLRGEGVRQGLAQ